MITMVQTLDTLNFANKLKAAGLDPKVAEVQAELQAEIQTKMLDEVTKNQDEMEQNLISKIDSCATKTDLNALELRFDVKIESLRADILSIRSDILMKLGGIMAGGMSILGILVTVIHYVR